MPALATHFLHFIVLPFIKQFLSLVALKFTRKNLTVLNQILFYWISIEIINKTFENVTQHCRAPLSFILKTNYKSTFPDLNVSRPNELATTDVFYCIYQLLKIYLC